MKTGSNKNIFFFSIDAHILPSFAKAPISELIYGIYGKARPAGLSRLLDMAESVNCRAVCFMDFCAYDIYGEEWLDVARYICARGHSLQLRAHPEFMSPETWKRLGLKTPADDLTAFNDSQASTFIDYLLDLRAKVTDLAPVAFRGGFYRQNRTIMDCLVSRGISIFSGNPARDARDASLQSFFYYPNGALEVPQTVTMPGFRPITLEKVDAFVENNANRSSVLLNPAISTVSLLKIDPYSRSATWGGVKKELLDTLVRAQSSGFEFARVEELAYISRFHGDPFNDQLTCSPIKVDVENRPLSLSTESRGEAISSFLKNNFGSYFNNNEYNTLIISREPRVALKLGIDDLETARSIIFIDSADCLGQLRTLENKDRIGINIFIYEAKEDGKDFEEIIAEIAGIMSSEAIAIIFGEIYPSPPANNNPRELLRDNQPNIKTALPEDFVYKLFYVTDSSKYYYCAVAGKNFEYELAN